MAHAGVDAGTLLLYILFASTGLGVVLPGTLLPQLLQRWSLSDQQAGALFFCFFVGSSAGAVLARGRLKMSLALGCLLTCCGCWALSVASRSSCYAIITIDGLGLGLAMTSVSLLQSRRRPWMRATEMARLNLIWALGACLAPPILLRSVVHRPLAQVLSACSLLFLLLELLVLAFVRGVPSAPSSGPSSGPSLGSSLRQWRLLPLALLGIVPFATGIESAAGGWLTTFSHRSGLMLAGTVSTVTCFWLGLLLSRFVQSYGQIATRSGRRVLRWAPWLAAAAVVLLLVGQGSVAISVAAFLLGSAIGPLYPLALALILDHGEAGNVAFLIAGIGASSLPLLTGLVSGQMHSLARGLLVLLVAAIAMGLLAGPALATGRSRPATRS